MNRAYTVAEIDDLRGVIRNKIEFGRYDGWFAGMRIGRENPDMHSQIEDRVRTHMIAGHTARDLIASDPPRSGVDE